MRACTNCKETKTAEEFYVSRNTKSGRTFRCKACWPKSVKTTEQNKRYNKTTRSKISAYIRESKNVPCSDCAQTYPYFVMEFDHVRDEKKFCIGHGLGRGLAAVQAEILKCEVVCSNCHRMRTHRRRHGTVD